MICDMLLKFLLIDKFSFTSFTFILWTRRVCPQVLPQQHFGLGFKVTDMTTVKLGWRNCVLGF